MRRDGLRTTLRLAAWTAGQVVVARLLLAAGSGSLSVPLTSLHDLSAWVSQAPPAEMTVALLRLAGLAASVYLLAVTALAVAARLVRVRGLVAAVDRVTPGVVRRIVTGGSGVGLVLGGVVASLPSPDLVAGPARDSVASAPATPAGPARAPSPPVATMTQLTGQPTPPGADAPVAEATMTRVDEPPAPSATMTRIDVAPARPTGAAATPVAATPATYGPEVTAAPAPPAVPEIDPTRWIVEPGDSLWSVAEDVMAAAHGTSPGERAVGRYWRRLVEANRAHLVDPGNADLLVPGQQLVVPPPDG